MKDIRLADAAPEVDQAYQVQLAHIAACGRCRMELPCEIGRRIRRALQAARSAATPINARRETGGL
jgi:hypothetical protein